MNVYEMYYEQGKQFGYYVKRHSWSNTIAKIISIKGVTEGEVIPGEKPYYGNPEVIAEFYKGVDKTNCDKSNCINVSNLSCPGTYNYKMI